MKIRELYSDVVAENLDYEYKASLNPDLKTGFFP